VSALPWRCRRCTSNNFSLSEIFPVWYWQWVIFIWLAFFCRRLPCNSLHPHLTSVGLHSLTFLAIVVLTNVLNSNVKSTILCRTTEWEKKQIVPNNAISLWQICLFCPSSTGIMSKRMNILSNFFDGWPGRGVILVFFERYRCHKIPRRTPSAEGVKCTGVGKICDFREKSPLISETLRDRPIWLLWITNSKS